MDKEERRENSIGEEAESLEVGGFLFQTSDSATVLNPTAVLSSKWEQHLQGSDSEEEKEVTEKRTKKRQIVVKPKLDASSDENWDSDSVLHLSEEEEVADELVGETAQEEEEEEDVEDEYGAKRGKRNRRGEKAVGDEGRRKKRRLQLDSDGEDDIDELLTKNEKKRVIPGFKKRSAGGIGSSTSSGSPSSSDGFWRKKSDEEQPSAAQHAGGRERVPLIEAVRGNAPSTSFQANPQSYTTQYGGAGRGGGVGSRGSMLGGRGGGGAGRGNDYAAQYQERQMRARQEQLEREKREIEQMKEQLKQTLALQQQALQAPVPNGFPAHLSSQQQPGFSPRVLPPSTSTSADPKKRFKKKASATVVERVSLYKGKIKKKEDFKHLCRKLTHTVVEKEEKHNPQFLVTSSTIKKIQKLVDQFFENIPEGEHYKSKRG